MIKTVIADDHTLVRKGIRALLDITGDIEVVGEAEDGYQALELVTRLEPDVLVLDFSMPKFNGLQVVERLQEMDKHPQIVMLSMHADEMLVQQALRFGAVGYLLKQAVTEELLLAIRAAYRGEVYLSPAITRYALGDHVGGKNADVTETPLDQLSTREREILKLIAEGNSNRNVAEMLTISVKTVETHRANIMSKLEVHDVTGLVRMAIKYGLISLDY
jgi:DNA-binding NarL/FixJ family response regulator